MFLFQSSCSGRRSKREEARGFMKMGHYLLQQVIVPPTEQMKSRDVLGISIATHTALVPRQHIQRFENPKFHAIFYGRGETTRRWGLGSSVVRALFVTSLCCKAGFGGLCHVEIGGGGTCQRRGWTGKVRFKERTMAGLV